MHNRSPKRSPKISKSSPKRRSPKRSKSPKRNKSPGAGKCIWHWSPHRSRHHRRRSPKESKLQKIKK